MIKICFYAHEIDYAGTWRSHEKIIECLDRNIFDPYIMYWEDSIYNNRLEIIKNKFGKNILIPFSRSQEKDGKETGYSPKKTNFKEVALDNKFDIIHFARSGYYEWPFVDRLSKLQVETNIFGARDDSQFLDKSIAISSVVHRLRTKSDVIIPNPIDLPENIEKDFSIRQKFGIKNEDIVLGRIGRPDNFDPIALMSFADLQKKINNIYYIIIGGCTRAKAFVINNNIKNVFFIEPTNDDVFLDKFNRNIDIFCHYRSDGETFGVAIATAMSYEIPVISHYAGYNNQFLTIRDGGLVATSRQEYYNYLYELCTDVEKRKETGKKARLVVSQLYEKNKIVKKIQNKYLDWLK